MKIWMKSLVGIVLGVIIGFLLPISKNNAFLELFRFASPLIVNLLLYFTLPYILIKMLTGIISMLQTKVKIWKLTGTFFLFIITSLAVSTIISLFVMNISILQPDANFDVSQQSAREIAIPTFGYLVNQIFSSNPLRFIIEPLQYILPLVLLALLLAWGTYQSGKRAQIFFETIKSLSNVIDAVVVQFVEVFSLLSFFVMGYAVTQMRVEMAKVQIFSPILSVIAVLVLFSIIIFALLQIVFKENLIEHFMGLLGAALTATITGNTVATTTPLSIHLKRNLNIDDDTVDFLVPLGIIFNRSGTVIVATVVLMSSIISLAPSILSLKLQMLIFGFTIFYSLQLDGVTENTFLILVMLLLNNSIINFESNSYLIFIGLVPLLSRFALFIDTMSTGIFIVLTAKYFGLRKSVEHKDYI